MSTLSASLGSFDASSAVSFEEDVVVQTPTAKGQQSSLWTERLHLTPEVKTKTPPSLETDDTRNVSFVKGSLFSPRDILKAAFASRTVSGGDKQSKSKTFLLSSPEDNLLASAFAPRLPSGAYHPDAPINICHNFMNSAFNPDLARESDADIPEQSSHDTDDSSSSSESLDPDEMKYSKNVNAESSDESQDDEISDDDLSSRLNDFAADIIRLTENGQQDITGIQYVVDDALKSGIPNHLLKNIVHGLVDNASSLNLDHGIHLNSKIRGQIKFPLNQHISSDTSPVNTFVHLAYASSVKAFTDDIRIKLIDDFDEISASNNYQGSGAVDDVEHTEQQKVDYDQTDTESDPDTVPIDDETLFVQRKLINDAFNLMQHNFASSDVEALCNKALAHNLDVTLFQDLFRLFHLHPKEQEYKEALLQMFIHRTISMAQQQQQLSVRSVNLLISAASACKLPTEMIKRRFLKEKKRWLEKRMLDCSTQTTDAVHSSSAKQERIASDWDESLKPVYHDYQLENSLKVVEIDKCSDNDDKEDTPRKQHVAEFHTIENGDAEFFLMEDDDIEVALFDESEEVRMIDEARESGKRKVKKEIDSSQHLELMDGSTRPQYKPLLKSSSVHAVSAAFALKMRQPLKTSATQAKKRKKGQSTIQAIDSDSFNTRLFSDWTEIVKTTKTSDERSWDAPDASLFFSERLCMEPNIWFGSFNPDALNKNLTKMTTNFSVFQITPYPQIFELASIQAQKVTNPSVGKIIVDLVNTRDQAKIHGGKISVFLSGKQVQEAMPTLGAVVATTLIYEGPRQGR